MRTKERLMIKGTPMEKGRTIMATPDNKPTIRTHHPVEVSSALITRMVAKMVRK
jgi:hypothetical protein